MATKIDFNTRHTTAWVIGLFCFGLIIWDVYAAFFTKGGGDTVSEVVLELAIRRPVFPFLFGVICGHFFWPQEVK